MAAGEIYIRATDGKLLWRDAYNTLRGGPTPTTLVTGGNLTDGRLFLATDGGLQLLAWKTSKSSTNFYCYVGVQSGADARPAGTLYVSDLYLWWVAPNGYRYRV